MKVLVNTESADLRRHLESVLHNNLKPHEGHVMYQAHKMAEMVTAVLLTELSASDGRL